MLAQESQSLSEVFVPSPVAEPQAAQESCSYISLSAATSLPALPTKHKTSDIVVLFFDWVSMRGEIPF